MPRKRKRLEIFSMSIKDAMDTGRITAEMRNRSYTINHKTLRRIMIEMGLKCQIRKGALPLL